ncbi:hypothetical protein H0H93_010295 [Arthromyces matolae]|nr:hypothetical protein H0H93_010295 [Arthromyces matolae]
MAAAPEVGMVGYIRKSDVEMDEKCNLTEIFTDRRVQTVGAIVLEDSMLAFISNIYITDTMPAFQWIYWKDVFNTDIEIMPKPDPSRWITLNPHCRIRKGGQSPVSILPYANSNKLDKPSVEKIQELIAKVNKPRAESSYFNKRVIFGNNIEVGMLFSVKREFINAECRSVIPEAEGGALLVLVHGLYSSSISKRSTRRILPFVSSQPPAGGDLTAIQWKADALNYWGLNAFLSQTGLNPKDFILMHKHTSSKDCFLVKGPEGHGDPTFYGTWQPDVPKQVRVTYPWLAPPHHVFEPKYIYIGGAPLKVDEATLTFIHTWQDGALNGA